MKAHWVKDNEVDVPPKIHNLQRLAAKTRLVLTDDEISFLGSINDFQLEERYPDSTLSSYLLANRERSEEILIEINKFRLWLLNQLK